MKTDGEKLKNKSLQRTDRQAERAPWFRAVFVPVQSHTAVQAKLCRMLGVILPADATTDAPGLRAQRQATQTVTIMHPFPKDPLKIDCSSCLAFFKRRI